MKYLTAALLLSTFASPALADEVVLRNGHKVVGIEREEDDRIIVETGYGTVSFPRDEVVSVTKGETAMHAWPVRYAEIEKSTNASDFTKLAAWARENRMPRYVDGLMRRAMELDPNNAEAREALGFVRHKDKWVTRAELRKEQGQVQDGGRWVTPLEKELAERRRLEAEGRRLERESERKRRDGEKRRKREEAELQGRIRMAEAAPTAYDGPYHWGAPYGYGGYGYGWGGYGWGGLYDVMMVDWLLGGFGSGMGGAIAPPGSKTAFGPLPAPGMR